jgi:signal transduction histidine kinase
VDVASPHSWWVRHGTRPWYRFGFEVGLVAGLYYGAAKLGYAADFAGPVAALVWLPAGVGIAALYFGGLRLWPGIVIGDLFANNYMALPVGSAIGQTCGNLAEIVIAAYLIRRLIPSGSPLGSARALARLLAAIAAGTLISAVVGSLSLRLGGVMGTGTWPTVWRTWWLGDFSGALLVVPLAIAWLPLRRAQWSRERVVETLFVLASVGVLSQFAMSSHRPLTYLVFPGLIWAALRFGPRGATLAIVVAATSAIWNVTHYEGPFHFLSITRSVLNTQLFIAVAAVSTLWLVALVAEREGLAERLGASRVALLEASAVERRRIERNLHDGAQQRLLALVVKLRLAAERSSRFPEQSAELFETAEADLEVAIGELRELAHGLDPSALTVLGLGEAMHELAARSEPRVVVDEVPSERLEAAIEATAYYIIAETVSNAQRHAFASAIHVRAEHVKDTLRVEVLDDGVGGAVVGEGTGLVGLRARVEGLGGTLQVLSPAGGGTRILAVLPAKLRAYDR